MMLWMHICFVKIAKFLNSRTVRVLPKLNFKYKFSIISSSEILKWEHEMEQYFVESTKKPETRMQIVYCKLMGCNLVNFA